MSEQNLEQQNAEIQPEPAVIDEKQARKARQRKRQLERRARRNARIARFRTLKNFIIWCLGVIFLPLAIVGSTFVVPISLITGNDEKYVSKDLSRLSLFEAARYVMNNKDTLGVKDFPVITTALDELQNRNIRERDDGTYVTFGDLVSIDTDKLKEVSFASENVMGDIQSCIEITATIDSVISESDLGEFAKIVFTDETEAGTVETVLAKVYDSDEEKLQDRKQYYYKSADGASYISAFDENGELVSELNDKRDKQLYYPPLQSIKLSELKDVFTETFGRTKISTLLEVAGIESSSEVAKIFEKVLGENSTVSSINNLEKDDIVLSAFLEETEENKDLWKILRAAVGVADDAEITLGDFGNFSTSNITLNSVLEEKAEPDAGDYDLPAEQAKYDEDYAAYEDNKQLWDVIREATDPHQKDGDGNPIEYKNSDITINNLADFSVESVRLNVIIEESEETEDLWKILRDATGVTGATDAEKNSKITISDLSTLKTDDMKLSSVLAVPTMENSYKNQKLYDILLDMTKNESTEDPVAAYGDIRLRHLGTIETDNIHLSIVLDLPDDSADPGDTSSAYYRNRKLYAILRDATGVTGATDAEKNANITLGSLDDFNVNNIQLNTVLDEDKNGKLFDILHDMFEKPAEYSIRLSDLNGETFDIGKVHLRSVIEEPDGGVKYNNYLKLRELVEEAAGSKHKAQAEEEGHAIFNYVTIRDLSEDFTVSNIKLTTVMAPTTENATLYSILREATGSATNDEITISKMGDFEPNDIKLNTVITSSTNKVLKPLLEKSPAVTIGTLGTAINDLDVAEIFDVECFTTESANAIDTNAKYVKSVVAGVETYTLSASGTYYISKDAKVWLFMFYTGSGVSDGTTIPNTKGAMNTYTKKSVKFNDMEDNMSSASESFTTATVKQLIQTGILTEATDYSSLYDKSFEDIISVALLMP